MFEPLLATVAADVLAGRADIADLLRSAEETTAEARRQLDDVRSRLQEETEESRAAMQGETLAAESSFEDFLRLAESCRAYASDFDPERLRLVHSELPLAASRLHLDLTRLHEALWICRGPSTHGGLNQLLALVHSDADLQSLYGLVPLELEKLQLWQSGIHQTEPAPLRGAAQEFAQELRGWLQRCPTQADFLDAWAEEGELLGREFARYDFHYLNRRHGASPTPLRLLNLALNAAWLRSGGHVADELVSACLLLLDEEFERLHGELTEETAEAVEILDELRTVTRRMQRMHDQELATLRPLAIELAGELHEALKL
jgi:hypothetical protein